MLELTQGILGVNTNTTQTGFFNRYFNSWGGAINLYTSTVAGTDAIKIEHADTIQASVNNRICIYSRCDIRYLWSYYGLTSATWTHPDTSTVGNLIR